MHGLLRLRLYKNDQFELAVKGIKAIVVGRTLPPRKRVCKYYKE